MYLLNRISEATKAISLRSFAASGKNEHLYLTHDTMTHMYMRLCYGIMTVKNRITVCVKMREIGTLHPRFCDERILMSQYLSFVYFSHIYDLTHSTQLMDF